MEEDEEIDEAEAVKFFTEMYEAFDKLLAQTKKVTLAAEKLEKRLRGSGRN